MLPQVLAALTVYTGLPADLERAVHAYDEAQVRPDRAVLERLLAPDYVLQNSAGKVQDRASFIADQLAPGYSLQPFRIEEPVQKVMGDVALLGGVATLQGLDGGQPFTARLRFVDVWQKRGRRWVVVMTQATRAPKD